MTPHLCIKRHAARCLLRATAHLSAFAQTPQQLLDITVAPSWTPRHLLDSTATQPCSVFAAPPGHHSSIAGRLSIMCLRCSQFKGADRRTTQLQTGLTNASPSKAPPFVTLDWPSPRTHSLTTSRIHGPADLRAYGHRHSSPSAPPNPPPSLDPWPRLDDKPSCQSKIPRTYELTAVREIHRTHAQTTSTLASKSETDRILVDIIGFGEPGCLTCIFGEDERYHVPWIIDLPNDDIVSAV